MDVELGVPDRPDHNASCQQLWMSGSGRSASCFQCCQCSTLALRWPWHASPAAGDGQQERAQLTWAAAAC